MSKNVGIELRTEEQTRREGLNLLQDLFSRSKTSSEKFFSSSNGDYGASISSLGSSSKTLDHNAMHTTTPPRSDSRVRRTTRGIRASVPSFVDAFKIDEENHNESDDDDDESPDNSSTGWAPTSMFELDDNEDYLMRQLKAHPIFDVPNVKMCIESEVVDPPLISLLNMIVPSFEIPELSECKELDHDTKCHLLEDIMVEFMCTLSNPRSYYQTQTNPVVPEGGEGINQVRRPSLRTPIQPRPGMKRGLSKDLSSMARLSSDVTLDPTKQVEHSITCVFDDMHNADEVSVNLMAGIIKHPNICKGFIIVASLSEDANHKVIDEVFDETDEITRTNEEDTKEDAKEDRKEDGPIEVTKINIKPLSNNEISSVLFSEFNLSSISDDLMVKILLNSNGNPGMAISYVRKLKDLGMLVVDNERGNCRAKDPDALEKFVSDDIFAAASIEYEKVDAKSKYILQLGSIMAGKAVPLPLIMRMYTDDVGKEEGDLGRSSPNKSAGDEERDFVALKFRSEAFSRRLQDLVDAKLVKQKDNMATIAVPGMAQVAYASCLHSSRYDMHCYAIRWFETCCTANGLRNNAMSIYQQCMSVEKYDLASKYFYMDCSEALRKGEVHGALKKIKGAELLLELWSGAIFETEIGSSDLGVARAISWTRDDSQKIPLSAAQDPGNKMSQLRQSFGAGGRRRESFHVFNDTKGTAGKAPEGLTEIQVKVGAINGSFSSLQHLGTMGSIEVEPPSTVGSFNCTKNKHKSIITVDTLENISKDKETRKKMLPASYCEMRCKFFECQIYVELKR